MNATRLDFRQVFERLHQAYGPQHWWPGDTPFEVMVGAVLTQNTAWSNVEQAIINLKANDCLSPRRIVEVEETQLAEWIRPSGYFNIKARRLRNLCRWYREAGEFPSLSRLPTDALRRALLGVNGVGPETADDILLYAFERPVFVIDAYTGRLFSRLGLIEGDEGYETLRHTLESSLGAEPRNVPLFNEYHALIVVHAKAACRKRPLCSVCPLALECPSALKEG